MSAIVSVRTIQGEIKSYHYDYCADSATAAKDLIDNIDATEYHWQYLPSHVEDQLEETLESCKHDAMLDQYDTIMDNWAWYWQLTHAYLFHAVRNNYVPCLTDLASIVGWMRDVEQVPA